MSGSFSKREGITYAATVSSSHASKIKTDRNATEVIPTTIASQIQTKNDEFLSKLNISIQNSQSCVNVAAESLNTAQKLLEKVDENMKLLARRECELFYNKTITEVD